LKKILKAGKEIAEQSESQAAGDAVSHSRKNRVLGIFRTI